MCSYVHMFYNSFEKWMQKNGPRVLGGTKETLFMIFILKDDWHIKVKAGTVLRFSFFQKNFPLQWGLENRTRKSERHPNSERFEIRFSNGPTIRKPNFLPFENRTTASLGRFMKKTNFFYKTV